MERLDSLSSQHRRRHNSLTGWGRRRSPDQYLRGDRYRRHIVIERISATCPTCKRRGEFEYLGEQHWPTEVARKLGLPEVIALWSCPCCFTTISESELLPARNG